MISLPKEKLLTFNSIVNDLQKLEGVIAIVLGGSYAAGVAKESSDLDIGIYYSDDNPFSIDDIKAIATKYSLSEDSTVTGFYEWGPWVNGGAWIETPSGKVDFLYRNLQQVTATIEKAKKGEWENHFEQQPPYGFSSIIYLAETDSCLPLYDPNDVIRKLKADVQPYPPALKKSVIQQSLWSAEFSIWHAAYFGKTESAYYLSGCITRAVKSIVTALFAINEIYPMGDKRAIVVLEQAPKCPDNLKEIVDNILVLRKEAEQTNIDQLKTLFKETVKLAEEDYKAFPYNLKIE